MKVILYSRDEQIIERWQQILVQKYTEIVHCSNYEILLSQLKENKCVVLFHLNVNGDQEFYKLISRYCKQKRIFVLVNSPDINQGIHVLHSGAHGYGNSNLCEGKLKAAVESVLHGDIWVDKEIMMGLLNRNASVPCLPKDILESPEILSKREKQIVDKVLLGKTNSQVALELDIKERTVKTHLNNIYRKTSTKSRFELTIKFHSNKYRLN